MKRIEIIYFDAGGGHRSAANALKFMAQQKNLPWDVNLLNLQELLDSIDVFRKLTGIRLQDIYNNALKKGWTWGSPQLIWIMHRVIRAVHGQSLPVLREYWMKTRPDLVVSVVPNFDRAIYQSLQLANPAIPMVTILTDMADYPPHFWIEPKQDQYFICGTDKAVAQALAIGHPIEKIRRASGMILNPRFYEIPPIDRAAERRKLGLDPDLPTALLLFGGEGSAAMETIVKRLDASDLKLQVIAICGHGKTIHDRLSAFQARFPLHTVGFTKEVPYFMQLADFFIGKPGPGSISEAIHMKLPVIVERNSWTLAQERYNTEWVREQGVGIVVKDFDSGTVDAVREMLVPEVWTRMHEKTAAIQNRAVFEIPGILAEILAAVDANASRDFR